MRISKALFFCAGLLVLTGPSALAENTKDNNQAKKFNHPAVMAVTTLTFSESTGCWARIYDGQEFSGRTLTLMGDQSLPNLEFPSGNDWEGDIDSIVVGPKASVVLFEDENYKDKKQELKPNEKIANLHTSLLSEGVESLKMTCL